MSRAAASSASSSRGRLAPSLAALLLAAAALPSGCLYGGPELDSVVQELNANSRAVYDYFIAKGLTPVQAAGIVGNLMQESNCSPTAVQSGGPGRGIAQWSVGGRWDHDRNDNAVAFAAGRGASVWSLALQLDFIWYELTTFSYYGLAQLRAATTVTAATVAFQSRFEGCGTCVQTQRIAYANQALAAYNTPSAPTWGATFVSQSFPYASAGAVSLVAGESARVTLTMRNSGSHAWDARTCLGTTQTARPTEPLRQAWWPGPTARPAQRGHHRREQREPHLHLDDARPRVPRPLHDERWGIARRGRRVVPATPARAASRPPTSKGSSSSPPRRRPSTRGTTAA
ncbi:MAG: phage tail tip lysozyme [Polyangiales bacterium]